MVLLIILVILLPAVSFFYNTLYEPDIDFRSLNVQYFKVKQSLSCL